MKNNLKTIHFKFVALKRLARENTIASTWERLETESSETSPEQFHSSRQENTESRAETFHGLTVWRRSTDSAENRN